MTAAWVVLIGFWPSVIVALLAMRYRDQRIARRLRRIRIAACAKEPHTALESDERATDTSDGDERAVPWLSERFNDHIGADWFRDEGILELRALGWTHKDIAAAMDCGKTTVGTVLRKAGV